MREPLPPLSTAPHALPRLRHEPRPSSAGMTDAGLVASIVARIAAFALALSFGAFLALAVSIVISSITNAHVQVGDRLEGLRTSWQLLLYALWIGIAVGFIPWLLRPLSAAFGSPMMRGNRASKFAERNRIASLTIFAATFAALFGGIWWIVE